MLRLPLSITAYPSRPSEPTRYASSDSRCSLAISIRTPASAARPTASVPFGASLKAAVPTATGLGAPSSSHAAANADNCSLISASLASLIRRCCSTSSPTPIVSESMRNSVYLPPANVPTMRRKLLLPMSIAHTRAGAAGRQPAPAAVTRVNKMNARLMPIRARTIASARPAPGSYRSSARSACRRAASSPWPSEMLCESGSDRSSNRTACPARSAG